MVEWSWEDSTELVERRIAFECKAPIAPGYPCGGPAHFPDRINGRIGHSPLSESAAPYLYRMALTHVDPESNQPRMVDIGDKGLTRRSATARSIVNLPEIVRAQFGGGDIQTKKGPVFQTAIIAGTMAAKRTHELIPFCHPLGIEKCSIRIELNDSGDVIIECTAGLTGRTGVEMEALTGASVAALTVYDMCKALSQEIVIRETRLIAKSGGKTDYTFYE